MSATKIPWATDTINLVAGCTRVSPGCDHCYALRIAGRGILPCYAAAYNPLTGDWTGEVKEIPGAMHNAEKMIARWEKPRRVFVQSMGDLFHDAIKDNIINVEPYRWAFEYEQHTFIMLTKRAKNMADRMKELAGDDSLPPNLWCGVTVENQAATTRIDDLLGINAPVKFISVEPMLGPVQILQSSARPVNPYSWQLGLDDCKIETTLPELQWVIIGAESGPGRRPCKLEWVKNLIIACNCAGIPVFVKQIEINGKLSHNPQDWPEWARRQEFPK